MSTIERDIRISFGDCDPAGIVWYPNYYRWFDNTAHEWFRIVGGGHAALCEHLGSAGLGLVDTGASFRSPAREGDLLTIRMEVAEWRKRSFRLAYTTSVGDRITAEGYEVRCVFIRDGERMRAGPTAPLRAIVDASA